MTPSSDSVVVSWLHRARDALRGAVTESTVATAIRDVRRTTVAAIDASRVVTTANRTGETLLAWLRGSWLYGWLTAEPDPEIIVIDLRETYTVGPVIAALDRIAAWVGPRWHESAPARLLDRVAVRTARALDGSWTAKLLERLLVPPEIEDEQE